MKYFPLGEDKFRELLVQLERAEHFIFLEYFIIDKGLVWDAVQEILVRKARQGVEVRLMYDGTCTLSLLPMNFPKEMEELGIRCKVFSPMRPFLSTHQNNRDHRKIVVIDGRTAFTGGVNLADEYINRTICKKSCKCAMPLTFGTDDLSGDNLSVFYFIKFKCLCMSEMLEYFTVLISYCNFHIYYILH